MKPKIIVAVIVSELLMGKEVAEEEEGEGNDQKISDLSKMLANPTPNQFLSIGIGDA